MTRFEIFVVGWAVTWFATVLVGALIARTFLQRVERMIVLLEQGV